MSNLPDGITYQDKIDKWSNERKTALKLCSDLSINVEIYDFHISQLDEKSESYQQRKEMYEATKKQTFAQMKEQQAFIKFCDANIQRWKELQKEAEQAAVPQPPEPNGTKHIGVKVPNDGLGNYSD